VSAGADRAQEAFERALAALARKERTVAELEAWLGERDFEEEAVAAALGRLVEIGELDDERFARRYAEDKRDLAGWGPERIRESLVARGVAADLVERALGSEDDVAARAAQVLDASGRDTRDERERARALAFLVRRGFPYEAAYDAIRAHSRRAA
jgi:regulatory protein